MSSIIGVTCSGTSSWWKCPEPTVTPMWRSGLSGKQPSRVVASSRSARARPAPAPCSSCQCVDAVPGDDAADHRRGHAQRHRAHRLDDPALPRRRRSVGQETALDKRPPEPLPHRGPSSSRREPFVDAAGLRRQVDRSRVRRRRSPGGTDGCLAASSIAIMPPRLWPTTIGFVNPDLAAEPGDVVREGRDVVAVRGTSRCSPHPRRSSAVTVWDALKVLELRPEKGVVAAPAVDEQQAVDRRFPPARRTSSDYPALRMA